jgi:hypothetical protein
MSTKKVRARATRTAIDASRRARERGAAAPRARSMTRDCARWPVCDLIWC